MEQENIRLRRDNEAKIIETRRLKEKLGNMKII